jgi:uncharacterized protein YndB with AHSA1/START domain
MSFVKKIGLILLIVVVAFFSLGILNPTLDYETAVTIRAPLEKTWNVLLTDSLKDKWIPNFKSIEILEGEKNKIGSVSKVVLEDQKETYAMTEELITFVPKKEFSFLLEGEVLKNTVNVTLEKIDSVTTVLRVKNSIVGENLFFKSIFIMNAEMFKEMNLQSYLKLKNLIEKTL